MIDEDHGLPTGNVPAADSVTIINCGRQLHVHMVLVDEEDHPIAQCTITQDILDGLIEAFKHGRDRSGDH